MLTITLQSRTLRPGAVAVRRLVGREGLSSLYEYALDVVATEQHDVVEDHLDALLDEVVRIGFVDDDAARSHDVWGVVRSIDSSAPEREGEPLVHRVVVVPRVWRATRHVRSQLVRASSAPRTARELLHAVDPTFDPEKHFELGGVTRPDADYRVQYEESTFAFVSRLLEDEGVGYRFAQHEDREQLVLFDNNAALPEPVVVPYVRADRPEARQAVVHDLRRSTTTVPGALALLDYNEQRPFPPPVATATAPRTITRALGTIVTSHDPFSDQPNGERLARMRMEEHVARQRIYHGRSSRHELHAGQRLRIENAPFGRGGDLELLVVEVRHAVTIDARAGTAEGYANEFVAIDASTPYRPPRHTPKPRVAGISYGVVLGPDLGAAAPVDPYGRYLVSLFYAPGGTTPWIRRVQPLAGANTGMHFPLRHLTEVAIGYIDGDPDRPVILGAVPNLLTASPVTRKNATENVIQTASGARIVIDDNA